MAEVVFRVHPSEVRSLVAAIGSRWSVVVERFDTAVYLRIGGPPIEVGPWMRRAAPRARRVDLTLLADRPAG